MLIDFILGTVGYKLPMEQGFQFRIFHELDKRGHADMFFVYLTVAFRFLARKKRFVARKKQATPAALTSTTDQNAAP